MSAAVLGILAASSLQVLGVAAKRAARARADAHGHLLAQDLLNEVLSKPLNDATGRGTGPSVEEAATGRAGFNDVDDFNNYAEGPPADIAGTPIPGFGQWYRGVVVDYVSPWNRGTVSAKTSDSKRITVFVYNRDRLVAQLVAYRTLAGDVLVAPGGVAMERDVAVTETISDLSETIQGVTDSGGVLGGVSIGLGDGP